MAENETKKNNNTQGGEGEKRQSRPPRGKFNGHHRGPRQGAPRKEDKGAGEENRQQKQGDKRPHRPHREERRPEPKQEQKQGGADRKREDKRREAEQAPKQPVVSPRRRQMQELLTAEQKAFAEASDIMLEEAERRKNAPPAEEEPKNLVEIVGIRFKPTGKIYYFSPAGISFTADDGVIVETARGQEYGFVALANRMVDEKETVQPLKPVMRKATEADTVKYNQNKEQEKRAVKIWEELVAKHKLSMSLTDIEYTFDNTKLIFYFTADGRVDFRELVKDLAAVFRTRIELRQIGVRDEAKLLGGLGVCGMPFCCNRFLSDFVQVSIKMAKEQNLSLSSSKISGNCGRLMCCLRYEQDVYEMEYTTFPKTDMIVRTPQGTGVVTESNFLNGKIKVRMDGDANAIKVFTRDEVKVIGRAKSRDTEPIDKELKMLED